MKNLIIIASAAFILSSCKKQMNEISPSVLHQSLGTDTKSINESLDKAALIVATSLQDPALRSFIKAEALKQFDGDYDVLYRSAKTIVINGRSLENIFSGATQARFSQAGEFESVISNVPNFQISVPVHCEEWNTDNDIPLVAISEKDADEKTLQQVKAYDSEGNIHFLSADAEPDMPVIVVGISERVDNNGALKYTFEGSSPYDERVNGQNTILGSIRCPDLGHIESWLNGKPELRLRIYGAKLYESSSTPTAVKITTKYYNPKRSDIDGVWYNPGTSLFNWYRYWYSPTTDFVYGSEVNFYWVEEDGGSGITIDLDLGGTIKTSGGSSLTVSLSTSFTIDDGDEDLGDAVVAFPDGTDWNVYSTGSELDFELD
ncbi:MAG TPA: DUF3103 family protein [Chitinophagales bacterium]|nr:DUF3103 family protein [Chitinophagales bacterium]